MLPATAWVNTAHLADAVRLVERRGQLMQEAVPAGQGAMAAILGLDDAVVVAVCADAAQGEVVSAVNFNSPGQVVIAGAKAAVERAMEACKAKGAKRALPLPVSVPSHCELMRPAAERFAESVAAIDWQAPQIPLVQNVSAGVAADLDSLRRDRTGRVRSWQGSGRSEQALRRWRQHLQPEYPGCLRRHARGAGLN